MLNQNNYSIKKGTKPILLIGGIVEVLGFVGSIIMAIACIYIGFMFMIFGAMVDSINGAIWGGIFEPNAITSALSLPIIAVCFMLVLVCIAVGVCMIVSGVKTFKAIKTADTFYERKGAVFGFGIFYLVCTALSVLLLIESASVATILISVVLACIGITKVVFTTKVKKLENNNIVQVETN